MNNQLLQKVQTIKQHRINNLKTDSPELQQKRMKFLNWLTCRQIEIPQVLEMYQSNEDTIYGKKIIPQYFKEYQFANTRQQLTTETRAEIDKLDFDSAMNLICDICLELIKNKIHFCVFYAEGQRSPHIIIYDFSELAGLSAFQRLKARAKFWRWIIPFRFHLLDHSIWNDEHYVPLEFSIHWKHQTPFNLVFEYVPEELPIRIVNPPKKRIYKTPLKKEKSQSIYYKSCSKCGSHSYLTQGNFYFCTNNKCLHREGKNAITTN
jgi:hypothetical protein